MCVYKSDEIFCHNIACICVYTLYIQFILQPPLHQVLGSPLHRAWILVAASSCRLLLSFSRIQNGAIEACGPFISQCTESPWLEAVMKQGLRRNDANVGNMHTLQKVLVMLCRFVPDVQLSINDPAAALQHRHVPHNPYVAPI